MIEDVIAGCVTQAGEQGANIGRLAVLLSGFPVTVPGVSLNRMCGSSQQAVHFAAQAIAAGDASYMIGCGVESMTRVPMFSDIGGGFEKLNPELLAMHNLIHQGESAERIAEKWGLTRGELDAFAMASHQRASAAARAGLHRELIPTPGKDQAGAPINVVRDEGIRDAVDPAKMASLATIFRPDGNGVVTAANSSQVSDGASAVLVADRERALADGFRPRFRFRSRVAVGDDPTLQLTAVIPATRKALERARLSVADLDRIEINEAFATVVLAWGARVQARHGEGQSVGRRDRPRPSAGRHRRGPHGEAGGRVGGGRRAIRPSGDVHRPRHGDRDHPGADRVSGGPGVREQGAEVRSQESGVRTPLGRTAGYFAAFIALGLFSATLGPTLPGLARHTGVGLSQISYLFTARSLGYLVGSLVSGRLYDRLPGHRLMAGVLVVMAAMMFLVPVIPLLPLLTAAMLLLGAGEGAVDVGGNALIVWACGGERVGPFMNALHFFFGVGAFLSPIVVAQAILLSGDIRLAYWALALLMLPAFVILLRTPSPASPAGQASGVRGQATARPGHAGRAGGVSPAPPARPALIALVSLFLMLYVAAEASCGGWIYTYAVARGAEGTASAAYLTSAFWGALTLGRLASIPLATRFTSRAIVRADLCGCLAGMAIILLAPGAAAIWAGALVVGFSMAAIFPTTVSFAGSQMALTGRVTGWFLVGASLGGMSLPWLIGQLFERIGPQIAMWLILADLILASAVFLLIAAQDRLRIED